MKIALLALVVTVAALGSACGQAQAQSPAVPPQVTAWERQLDHLHDLIGGSPRERAAAELVAYHRREDPFAACMRAHGVDYTSPRWVNEWQGRTSRNMGSSASAFLQPIDDPDFAVRVERSEARAQRQERGVEARADRAYAGLDPAAKARWDHYVHSCHYGRESGEGWHPAVGYQPLMNAYYDLMALGDGAAATHARGYRRCMTPAGFPADDASALTDMLLPNPPLSAWVNRVHRAMAADARCRRSAFLAGWRALGPQIGAWEHAHAPAITALHRRWQRLVRIAAGEPGWNWS